MLLGRDDHSVCALVPDQRVIDRGFHEVTLVDMGDTAGPHVSVADLSVLWLQVLQWRGFGTLQCGQYRSRTDSLCCPRNILRRDSDEESPRKSCRRTRRVHTPQVEDVPTILLSPVAVSARDPDAIIYDCRPPILPVPLRMKALD